MISKHDISQQIITVTNGNSLDKDIVYKPEEVIEIVKKTLSNLEENNIQVEKIEEIIESHIKNKLSQVLTQSNSLADVRLKSKLASDSKDSLNTFNTIEKVA